MTSGSSYLRGIQGEIPCVDCGQLAARIEGVSLKFKTCGIDLDKPCGKTADSASRCSMTWYLPTLNAAMRVASMHVFEHSPGKFTLSSVPNASSNYQNLEGTLLECVTLVYLLLKEHRCVTRLDVGESAVLFCYFPALISKALVQNSGLEEVRVQITDVRGSWRATHALAILSSALAKLSRRLDVLDFNNLTPTVESIEAITEALRRGTLRRLVMSNVTKTKIAGRLFRAVGHSSCLSELEIEGTRRRPIPNAATLTGALTRSKTLRKLKIACLENGTTGTLLKSLKDNDILEELALCYTPEEANILWEGLEMLRSNRALKCLRLVDVGLNDSCALIIADILRENNVLQEVCLSSNSITDLGAGALAKALQQNSTLKRLDISECMLSYEALSIFVTSLSLNTTVEYVGLGGVEVPETWTPSTPLTANICVRLDVAWNTRGLRDWASSLRRGVHHFSRLCVSWTSEAESSGVAQWFDAAQASGISITELVISCPRIVACQCDEATVSFLEGTSSLKKITLRSKALPYRYVNAVIRGLVRNKSVSEADFRQFLPVDYDVKPLRDLMRTNRTLHRLSFKAHYVCEQAVRSLARALEDNFVLLSFDLERSPNVDMYPIIPILDRNHALLNRAVECVLNSSAEEESIKALRLLSATDSLLDEVAKVSGKGREECKILVQESIRRLQIVC